MMVRRLPVVVTWYFSPQVVPTASHGQPAAGHGCTDSVYRKIFRCSLSAMKRVLSWSW